MRVALTGATGFLGGALTRAYRSMGADLVALVRKSSYVPPLEELGVELIYGDLTDENSLIELTKSADLAIHCAAYTGEFGPWDLFYKTNILSTKNFLEACLKNGCPRSIYVSSVAVYGNGRQHRGTEEDAAYESLVIDYYTRSKIAADKLALDYFIRHNLPVTVVRPGYIWGEGDRAIMPRLIEAIKLGRLAVVDGGKNLMNLAHVDNVVDGVLLAAKSDNAIGQAYNLTDGSKITTRRFLEDIIRLLGIKYKLRSFPYVPAYSFAFLCEYYARLRRYRIEPLITRYAVRMGKYDQVFNISKAVYQLGYNPKISYNTGMAGMVNYLRTLYYGQR